MTIEKEILDFLYREAIVNGETQIPEYAMKRRQEILNHHYSKVCRLYEPGEGGQKNYYHTKLDPKNRKNQNKIYAKTQEELESKIIAYYLKLDLEKKLTLRNVLLAAVDEDSKTGKRTIQRFDKRLSSLANIKVSQLQENHIKSTLENLVNSDITVKEFNETVGCLNKIVAHCTYEHIDIIDIKQIICVFRKVKLTGKHCFKDTTKQTKNLAFNRTETSKIVKNALANPSYKSLAVAILLLTGLRVGELLALNLEDIHLEDGYIWIHQIEDTKTFEILDYVKENKSREVYLDAEAEAIIRLAIAFRKLDKTDSPFLLLNENADDGKMHLRAIDNYMRKEIHHNVLEYNDDREPRSPHDCRRTYASLQYLNGTDIYTLKNQLGHSKITQTEEYIKDIIEASERRSRLKGTGIICDLECRRTIDAKNEQ